MTATTPPADGQAQSAPAVSVVIPAYNAAGFIGRAVRSVQEQTLQDFEIVIVDDVSTDDTVSTVTRLSDADPRIRLVRSPLNGGPAAARNLGLDAARGEWIAILDADDAYHPERLATLVGRARDADLDMIADNIDLYDYHSEAIVEGAMTCLRDSPTGFMPLDLETFLRNDIVDSGYQLGLMKPIYRSAFLSRSGLRYKSQFRHGEDSHLYSEILAKRAKAEISTKAFYIYTPTIGPVSGKISANTRTRIDYVKKAQSCSDFLAEYGTLLTSTERKLVESRRSRMLELDRFLDVMEARKQTGSLKAALRFAADPVLFRFLAPLALRKIKAKIVRARQ